MKNRILCATILALSLAAAPLAAQQAYLGLALNVSVPTGGFSSTTYDGPVTETFDAGLGMQFTASFPVDRRLALRLNVGAVSFDGRDEQPGYPRYNLKDDMFSLGGEAQLFLGDGSATRHLGGYLIGGASMDWERFSGSQDDPSFYADSVDNRTRLAGVAGFGYSFRNSGRWRWTLEAVYHKTLTGTGVWPGADFVRCSVGMLF